MVVRAKMSEKPYEVRWGILGEFCRRVSEALIVNWTNVEMVLMGFLIYS